MFYQPPRTLGILTGAALTAWAAAVAVVLGLFAAGRTFDWVTTVAYLAMATAAVLALLFLYWTYNLATLSYSLDRNGLVLRWGPHAQIVPLAEIERLVPGTSVGVPRVRGVSWMGHHVGSGDAPRIGSVLFYSTHQSPDQVLYVMTSERNYAISVQDPAEFARQIQSRQDLGETGDVTHHVERSLPHLEGFWSDRGGLLLALLAILAGAAVWLVVAWRYPDLPATLEISFPPGADSPLVELVGRSAILELPRVASALLVLNLAGGIVLYAWDRIAARAVFAATVLLESGFIAAFLLATREL